MTITFLGSGTSHGVPVVNCKCKCCTSTNPKDTRWRCSIKVVSNAGAVVIVDTGPEFRLQTLKYGLEKLDAVFLTHSHADHLHGLDDVRIFAHTATQHAQKSVQPLNIFANTQCLKDIKHRFDYVFKKTQAGGGKPFVRLIDCKNYSSKKPIVIKDLEIVPVAMMHGNVKTTGWVFRQIDDENVISGFAYLTDCSYIPPSSIEIVKNCQKVCIDALREQPHPTHLNFSEAIDYIKQMNGTDFYFTHISHETCDDEILEAITHLKSEKGIGQDKNIQSAYDGLVVTA